MFCPNNQGMKFNPLLYKPPKAWQAQWLNNATFQDYYFRLQSLFISQFGWKNLPDTVNERFLELTLYEYGFALYFDEPDIGNLALTCQIGGQLDLYRIPTERRPYANNGYNFESRNEKNSVLIFNNYSHTPSVLTILLYARRLYEIERAIDVNVKGQKFPVAILCDETQRLTYKNLYAKYDGNEPFIMGVKGLDVGNINTIQTNVPYVADKLNALKRQIWNEALAYCGIDSNAEGKRERLVTAEAESNFGAIDAQRKVMLSARQEAVDKINKMFGTNIEVDYKSDRGYNPDLTEAELATKGGYTDGKLYD